MTARSLALAWASGASLGYLVGWLAGSNVLKLAEGHRLGRPGVAVRLPEPRTAPPAPTETPEGGNGPQTGAQPRWVDLFGIDPDYTDGVPVGEFIERNRAGHDLIPAQRDDGPCPQYSPGGGIPCSVTGEHTAHIFLGSAAPDRKDDADERID